MKKFGVMDFLVMALFVGIGILMNIPAAHAVAAPTTGGFAQTVYDVGITDILKGPIGFVGGVGAIVFGAVSAIQGRVMQAAPAVLGGAALLQADTIVESLGAIV